MNAYCVSALAYSTGAIDGQTSMTHPQYVDAFSTGALGYLKSHTFVSRHAVGEPVATYLPSGVSVLNVSGTVAGEIPSKATPTLFMTAKYAQQRG